MKTRSTAAERAEWLAEMRADLPPGTTVHTILRHVSRSGMTRDIDLLRMGDDREGFRWLSYRAAAILGESMAHDAIRVSGAGMDMGFHLVYNLSHRLYPDGSDCAGEDCPSNDHSNGDRDYTPHHHANGGYALRQRWL